MSYPLQDTFGYNSGSGVMHMTKKRIIFMGTPEIAADVLEALIHTDTDIVLAVTQPDKKTGRRQVLTPSPVKQLAQAHNIPVFQPAKIRTDYQAILDARPDLIVTCAYGQIVPDEVLNAPVHGAVNLHGSLLPRYRGGAPIQRAIWDGLTQSGMTLMKMASKMDAGPVLTVKTVDILPEDNAGTVFKKMGTAAGELITEQLDTLLKGDARFQDQDERKATYAPVIRKEEEKLDLSQPDETILNQIRALTPAPGPYVIAQGKKLKILKAHLEPGTAAPEHTFVAPTRKSLAIQLASHLLVLEQVQLQGKPAMAIDQFMNGQGRSFIQTLAA